MSGRLKSAEMDSMLKKFVTQAFRKEGISKIKSEKKKYLKSILVEFKSTEYIDKTLYDPVKLMVIESLRKMPEYKSLSSKEKIALEDNFDNHITAKVISHLEKVPVEFDKLMDHKSHSEEKSSMWKRIDPYYRHSNHLHEKYHSSSIDDLLFDGGLCEGEWREPMTYKEFQDTKLLR